MSGVFYIGLGERFDADTMNAYPPGSVIVLPGNTYAANQDHEASASARLLSAESDIKNADAAWTNTGQNAP
jgi:hypothetical protein